MRNLNTAIRMSTAWMESEINFKFFEDRKAEEQVSFWIAGADKYNEYEYRYAELKMSFDEYETLQKEYKENGVSTISKDGVKLTLKKMLCETSPNGENSCEYRYNILVEFSGENFYLKINKKNNFIIDCKFDDKGKLWTCFSTR